MVGPAAGLALLAPDSGGYYPGVVAVATMVALLGLAIWVAVAPNALSGASLLGLCVLVLLIAFAAWTLLSGTWSHAPGLALIDFDRVLLYATVFAAFALVGRTGRRVRVLVALLAAATVAVAVVGLGPWLLPDVFRVSQSFPRGRMSFPTGYWNTTGLLASLGVVWCLHLASAPREHWIVRIAGASAIVPLVAVLGFTASRGALLAAVGGVVAYVLAARSRNVAIGALACAPGAALTALLVSRPSGLVALSPAPAAIAQGHRWVVLLALLSAGTAVFRGALVVIDKRVEAVQLPAVSWRARIVLGLMLATVIVGVGLAAHVPGHVANSLKQFSGGPYDAETGVSRLTSLSSDGRSDLWHVAIKYGFAPHPLRGSGAGTFAALWNRYRVPGTAYALVAHSLYVGMLGELGIVGAVLLFSALVAILVALARRTTALNGEGTAWAALLGAAVGWLLFAAVDWSWEMPACTMWLFAAGGLAVSRLPGQRPPVQRFSSRVRRGSAIVLRLGIVGCAVGLALIPYALAHSDASLDRAISDLQRDDCPGASHEANISRGAVSQRAEPYMILAACAVRQRNDVVALRLAGAAVSRDPENWEVHYTQALVRAASDKPPWSALRSAVLRNPMGGYATTAFILLHRVSPKAWRRVALQLPLTLAVSQCGGPSRGDQVAPCGDPRLPTLGRGPTIKTSRGTVRALLAMPAAEINATIARILESRR